MTLSEFLAVLAKHLKKWPTIEPFSISYIDDSVLEYDPPRKVLARRKDLFRVTDIARWRDYLEGTHSWVHANLLTTSGGDRVVSLRHGPPTARNAIVGDVPFSVNFSVEKTPLVIEG